MKSLPKILLILFPIFLGLGIVGALGVIILNKSNLSERRADDSDNGNDVGLVEEEILPESVMIFGLPSNLNLDQLRQLKPNAVCRPTQVRVPYGISTIKLDDLPEIGSQSCEIEKPSTGDDFADSMHGLLGFFIDDAAFPNFKGQLLYLQNRPSEDLPLESLIPKLKSTYNTDASIKRDLVYGAVPIQMFEFPINLRNGYYRLRVMASDYRGEEKDATIALYFDNLMTIDTILRTTSNKASQEAEKRIDDFLK